MPKFRKKPVEIEAVQWFPGVKHSGVFADPLRKLVEFMAEAPVEGSAIWDLPAYYVTTIHKQQAFLVPGDWILPEPEQGFYYPCKPDIFAASYDPA